MMGLVNSDILDVVFVVVLGILRNFFLIYGGYFGFIILFLCYVFCFKDLVFVDVGLLSFLLFLMFFISFFFMM